MRERGLKFYIALDVSAVCHVAPYAGAWIEIMTYASEDGVN